jgi:hypothetical protein
MQHGSPWPSMSFDHSPTCRNHPHMLTCGFIYLASPGLSRCAKGKFCNMRRMPVNNVLAMFQKSVAKKKR